MTRRRGMACDVVVATIYTVGHSTHSREQFLELLAAHAVKAVADVRRFPASRRHPHFNQDEMKLWLEESGIRYEHFVDLGGRRRARTDSVNLGWRNESFRGYADYLQTEAFRKALEGLEELARQTPTATMCAEAVPWRCHRSLISDALVVRGWRVLDILSPAKVQEHKLPGFARVSGTTLTYPGEADLFTRGET
jgi:uncharacterized protein (DUF488 family)